MKVSIVIPAFNAETSIKKCLNGLLRQTYNDIEIIVVDDGSVDRTKEICEFVSSRDSRVKVFHINNSGSGVARNYGIKQAQGDYLMFVDADDELSDCAIEKMVNYTENSDSDLVVFGFQTHKIGVCQMMSEKKYQRRLVSGTYLREHYDEFYGGNQIWSIQGVPWNKFYNLKVIRENNIEFPSLRRHQDNVFVLRYLNSSNCIEFVEDVLYKYYMPNTVQTVKKLPENYADVVFQLYEISNEIVIPWNPENRKVHQKLMESLAFGTIKASEANVLRMKGKNYIFEYGKFRQILSNSRVQFAIKGAQKLQYPKYQIILRMTKLHMYFCVYILLCIKKALQKR